MKRNEKPSVSAVVPAAGIGRRMKSDTKKQFMEINGKPVLAYTLMRLSFCSGINDITVSCASEDIVYVRDIVKTFSIEKVKSVVAGGDTRQESVHNGVLETTGDYILIHDGVRPFISAEDVRSVIDAAFRYDAAAAGIPLNDTIKLVNKDGLIEKTLNRDNIVRIQTPQVIKREIYLEGYKKVTELSQIATDDLALAEAVGVKPAVVYVSPLNIKITDPNDLETARILSGERSFFDDFR